MNHCRSSSERCTAALIDWCSDASKHHQHGGCGPGRRNAACPSRPQPPDPKRLAADRPVALDVGHRAHRQQQCHRCQTDVDAPQVVLVQLELFANFDSRHRHDLAQGTQRRVTGGKGRRSSPTRLRNSVSRQRPITQHRAQTVLHDVRFPTSRRFARAMSRRSVGPRFASSSGSLDGTISASEQDPTGLAQIVTATGASRRPRDIQMTSGAHGIRIAAMVMFPRSGAPATCSAA